MKLLAGLCVARTAPEYSRVDRSFGTVVQIVVSTHGDYWLVGAVATQPHGGTHTSNGQGDPCALFPFLFFQNELVVYSELSSSTIGRDKPKTG